MWWGNFVLCVAAAMIMCWAFAPPGSIAGIILWYTFDLLPREFPWATAEYYRRHVESWFTCKSCGHRHLPIGMGSSLAH